MKGIVKIDIIKKSVLAMVNTMEISANMKGVQVLEMEAIVLLLVQMVIYQIQILITVLVVLEYFCILID